MKLSLLKYCFYSLLVLASNPTLAAVETVCGYADVSAASDHIQRLTGQLQAATYRGDLEKMTEYALLIESILDSCTEAGSGSADTFSCLEPETSSSESGDDDYLLGQVCDYDCHQQLTRYHLFMSGDFLFLSNKDNPIGLDKLLELAKDHADLCAVPIAKRGLSSLMRKQNTCLDVDGCENADLQEESLEIYVIKQFNLSRLYVQALLASADISYQSSSDLELKKIVALIKDTTGEETQLGNTLQMAYARYKKALWSVIEMQTNIPNMARFDSLRAVSDELRFQVQRRIDSIEKGFLFLDIDPDLFTTIKVDELSSKLLELKNKVIAIESSIDQLRDKGLEDRENDENQSLEEKRTISNMEINVNSQKIVRLQDLAQQHSLELEGQINQLESESLGLQGALIENGMDQAEISASIDQITSVIAKLDSKVTKIEGDKLDVSEDILAARQNIIDLESNQTELIFDSETLSYRTQIRRLEFDLRKTLNAMQFEKQQIEALKEKDLLALNRQRILEEQAKYQWLVNWEITNLNLDLHIKSLGAQIYNYSQGITEEINRVAQLQNEGQILKGEFEIYEKTLKSYEITLAQLFHRRYVEFLFARLDNRDRICAIESQLAYLGETSEINTFAIGGNGVFAFPSFDGSVSDGSTFEDLDVLPIENNFSYELFARDDYPQECRDQHSDIFALAGLTVDDGYTPNPDLRNLDASQFPFVANISYRSENPIETLFAAMVQLNQADQLGGVNVLDLLDEANTPCEIPIIEYSRYDHYKAMCGGDGEPGLRQALIDQQASYYDFLIACVYSEVASDPLCSNQSHVEMAKAVYEKQKSIAKTKVDNLMKSVAELEEFSQWLFSSTTSLNLIKNSAQAMLSKAHTIVSSTAAIPVVTIETGSSGTGAHAVTTTVYEATEVSKAVLGEVETFVNFMVATAQDKQELNEAINRLSLNINELKLKAQELESEEIQIGLSETYALAELSGQRLGVEQQAAELKYENQIMIENCELDYTTWSEQVNNYKIEHARLLTNMDAQSAGVVSTDHEINKTKALADQILLQQDQIRSKINGLNLEIENLQDGAIKNQRLIENSVLQMCEIRTSKEQIASYNEQIDDTQLALQLIDEAIEKNIIDTYEISREQIETAITTSEQETEALLALQEEGLEIAEATYSNSMGIIKSKSEINSLERLMNQLDQNINDIANMTAEQREEITALREQLGQLAIRAKDIELDDLELDEKRLAIKQEVNDFQQETHGAIIALREEISEELALILTETAGQKEFNHLRTQKAIADLSMGIPEFIDVKKRLLQQTNVLLNYLRSRLRAIASFNTESGLNSLTSSTTYVRNSYKLDEAIDRMTYSFDTSELELPKGNTTTIPIEVESAFFQELLANKKARFEIAPLLGETSDDIDDLMLSHGYYTLWNQNFEYPNARLVDIIISTTADCPNLNIHSFNLRHLGEGVVFLPIHEASTVFGASITSAATRTVYTSSIYNEYDSTWPAFSENWKLFGGGGLLREFEDRLEALQSHGSSQGSGIFLGLPIAGEYELVLHENSDQRCKDALRAAGIKLHFLFFRDLNDSIETF